MKLKNLSGKKFKRLTAIKICGRNDKSKKIIWLCRCRCGRLTKAYSAHLLRGNTKSCGCLNRDTWMTRLYKHGQHKTRTYIAWKSMNGRCSPANYRQRDRYLDRGITVCRRWSSFENFLKDMGKAPAGLTLERIDNNKGYSPSNCKWATRREQMNNTRYNVWITALGATLTITQWSRVLGVTPSAISGKMYKGVSGKDAVESIILSKMLSKRIFTETLLNPTNANFEWKQIKP